MLNVDIVSNIFGKPHKVKVLKECCIILPDKTKMKISDVFYFFSKRDLSIYETKYRNPIDIVKCNSLIHGYFSASDFLNLCEIDNNEFDLVGYEFSKTRRLVGANIEKSHSVFPISYHKFIARKIISQ